MESATVSVIPIIMAWWIKNVSYTHIYIIPISNGTNTNRVPGPRAAGG